MSDLVSVKNLSNERISELVQKVRLDLAEGVKVFGTEANRIDTIRVWTKSENEVFGVVTTSGNRFESSLNLLKIQSFRIKPYLKLTILLGDGKNIKHTAKIVKLNDNFFELEDDVQEEAANNFIQEYLQSRADRDLTKFNFEKYAYNRKQYEWISQS